MIAKSKLDEVISSDYFSLRSNKSYWCIPANKQTNGHKFNTYLVEVIKCEIYAKMKKFMSNIRYINVSINSLMLNSNRALSV